MDLTRAFRPPALRDVLLQECPGVLPPMRPPDSRCEDISGRGDGQSCRRGREPAKHRKSSAGLVTKLTFQTHHGTISAIPPGDGSGVSWRGHESHE
jgi:hypothetical protein